MDRDPSATRWLCIDCGEIYERATAEGRCPRCCVQLIELGRDRLPDRLAALASAAVAHKRRRVETGGLLAGAAFGLGLAVLLGYVGSGWAVAILAPLLAILFAGIGWLLLPSVWAGAFVKKNPGLVVPGISRRRRIFAAVATLLALPVGAALVIAFSGGRAPKPLVVFVAAGDDLDDTAELEVLHAATVQLAQLGACHTQTSEPKRGDRFVWQLKWRVDAQGQPTLITLDPDGGPMADCVRRLAATWSLPRAAGHPLAFAAEARVRRSLLLGTVSVATPTSVTLQYLRAPSLP